MSTAAADPHESEVTRLVVVRHGETTWNAEMRMQGQLDTALSARGRRQAQQVAQALAEEDFDAVYSSDLERAFDTATAIAAPHGLPIVKDRELRERSFGVFQGSTYAEIDLRWPLEAPRWRRHDPDFAPDGGETVHDFCARAVAAVARIAARHGGGSIVIATHGGVLDCLYRAARRIGLDAPRTWELGNATINRLLWTPRGFNVVGWDDAGHLEEVPLDDAGEGDVATTA